jgi:hypothetical protein
MACNRITAGITESMRDERPAKAMLDPYNPTGSTNHVRFTTTKAAAGKPAPSGATLTTRFSTADTSLARSWPARWLDITPFRARHSGS